MLRLFLLPLFLLVASAVAIGAEVSSKDATAIRAVITEQLDAFARDDAARAFSLATSGIRARFGTAEAFLGMVRADYPVVYRPKKVEFEKPVVLEGEIIQPVKLIDADGNAWLALYPMQRQRNGAWRIDGCQLARLAGRQV